MDKNLFIRENIEFTDSVIRIFHDMPQNAVFVVDRNLYALREDVRNHLIDRSVYLYDAGEENKNLAEVEKIYAFLLENHRQGPLVALGGGITGDVAGFAAATFKRGIPFIMVPTTVVSMCDSAAGGKLGVNYKHYKNYIGVFRKPEKICVAFDFLDTLTEKELKSGLGELIKYGLLGEGEILDALLHEKNTDLRKLPYGDFIKRSLGMKLRLVEEDFLDKGIRNILNLGHNTAHALESVMEGKIAHGEAVALGLLAELRLSEDIHGLSPDKREMIFSIMKKYAMQTKIRGILPQDMINAMKKDKKNDEHMRFSLLDKEGKPVIKIKVHEGEILQAVKTILE